jgi:hypothetical protein
MIALVKRQVAIEALQMLSSKLIEFKNLFPELGI